MKPNSHNRISTKKPSLPMKGVRRKALEPDAKQMRDFIKLLHTDTNKRVCYQTYSKDKELNQQSASFSSKLTTILRDRLVAENRKGMNVSVAVNSIVGKARSAKNVNAINAVFIDCDGQKQTLEKLLELPIAPNFVVETSPGNFHAYWVTGDCSVEQFKSVQLALAKRFKSDASVSDAGRAMRLPGSINWKYKTPFLARLVHQKSRKPIALKVLAQKLSLEIDEHQEQADGTAHPVQLMEAPTERIEVALDRINADDRDTWLRVGMAIFSVMPNEAGYATWTKWSRGSANFDEQDQRRTWSKLKPNGIGIGTLFWLADMQGDSIAWDNFSMGKLFAKNYCNQLRYDASMGKWYAFNGVAWSVDAHAPLKSAKGLIEDLSAGNSKRKDGLANYRSASGLNTILRVAELEDEIAADSTLFDRDANVLALKNGVVDLVTGEFRQARADEFLRRQADVMFDEAAECPLWRKFIKQVTCGDRDLARFLQVAVGYTLFGHAKAQVFFVLDGLGGNGKGVFLRMLVALLGQYAGELSPNIVTSAYSGNVNGATSALMMLKGLRLGIVTELPSKKSFDTAFVKQYAGGDSITARPLHGEMVTFKPEGKLWVSTNDMPEIAANDHAMWRRVVTIPFKASFSGDKRDDHLEDALLLELSGILNWALEGAREYAASGRLIHCEAVEKHKERMRRDADVFGSWLKERCIPDTVGKVQSAEAYASYAGFAKKTGRHAMGMPAFGMRMAKEGFQRKSTKKFNVFEGLTLKQ